MEREKKYINLQVWLLQKFVFVFVFVVVNMEEKQKDINLQVWLLQKFGKAVSSHKLCDQPKIQPWLVGHHPIVP